MGHKPGPLCIEAQGNEWQDSGTLSRTRFAKPGVVEGEDLTEEEREVLLDITQISLDLVGIIDPSPVSDGSNMAISIGRGDWFGAGISGFSLIPYIGDVAKVGKIGRWAKTIEKAVDLAHRNTRFAEKVTPVLEKLLIILREVPTKMLPEATGATVRSICQKLEKLLGHQTKAVSRELVTKYSQSWTKYIDQIHINVPGKDKGILYSKLDPKPPTIKRADGTEVRIDAPIDGKDLVAEMVNRNLPGFRTLEMSLPANFQKQFDTAYTKLAEEIGDSRAWKEFGVEVWTQTSEKFARQLQGRVKVFVDDEVLKKALIQGNLPILTKELQVLIKRKRAGQGITTIKIHDIFDGKIIEI